MIRSNTEIKGITIHNKEEKLGQYADDTQLYLDGSEKSLSAAVDTLNKFYQISGLRMNTNKTKAIWIGSMIGCNITLTNDLHLDWHSGDFEILGITLNASLKDLWVINTRKRLEHINRLLASLRRRNLTLIGKITVIKTLAISTLVHIFSALPNPPKTFIDELNKIIYRFLWNNKNDKIKRSNITRNYVDGGLRMVNIECFINALKLSTLKQYLHKTSNLKDIFPLGHLYSLGSNAVDCLPYNDNPYWRYVLSAWRIYYEKHTFDNDDLNQILAQPLWLNHLFKSSYIIKNWFDLGIHCIRDICNENGFLDFETLKQRYKISGTFLDYQHLLNNIPKTWRGIVTNRTLCLNQLNINSVYQDMISNAKGSRIFYDKLIKNNNIPKVLEYWNNFFQDSIIWNEIFGYYRKCTKDCKLLDFQYRFIYRTIYTKKELLKMKLVDNDICIFCKNTSEDISHLFFDCELVKNFWHKVEYFLNTHLECNITLTQFIIMFGLCSHIKILNHIILLAKRFIYISSIKQHALSFEVSIKTVKDTCTIEKYIARKNNSLGPFFRKWKHLPDVLGTEH